MLKETNNEASVFLSLLWQEHLLYLDFTQILEDKSLDEAELAIILSVNYENYERFLSLEIFTQLLKKLHLRADIFNIQSTQVGIYNALKEGFFDKDELIKALHFLSRIQNNEKSIHFLSKLQSPQTGLKNEFLKQENELEKIALKLLNLSKNELFNANLRTNLTRFKENKFNIIIAGVMNAGKSSLLNALLKTEILGVSNIPETANLSIINYGESPKAKLYFWDRANFETIKENAKYDENLAKLLQELEPEIKKYIKEKALSEEFELKEIQSFSSAQNKLSVLISKIELFAPLEFLQDRVCIVDTPGLDDVLIQRELLTKEYLLQCDFLVYLMSASQSLSKKDSDFLLSLLLNSRISRFLILISKADLFEKSELDEIEEYVKKTLKERLKEANADEDLIYKLDFLSISSKKALNFYQKKADEKALLESKIPELEFYLKKQIFSPKRLHFILEAFKKELFLHIQNLKTEIINENKILQEANLHNDKEFLAKSLENEAKKAKFEELKAEIRDFSTKLNENKTKAKAHFNALFKRIEDKLSDEYHYAKQENKALMKFFLRFLEDGFIDILRTFRFEALKALEALNEKLALKYGSLQVGFTNDLDTFRTQSSLLFKEFLKADLSQNLQKNLVKLIDERLEFLAFNAKLHELLQEFNEKFDFQKSLENLNEPLQNAVQEAVRKFYEHYEKEQREFEAKFTHLSQNQSYELLQKNKALLLELESIEKGLNNAN